MTRKIDRKEIARIMEVTVGQVRSNERRWGIDAARVNHNGRDVRYWRERTLKILGALGLI